MSATLEQVVEAFEQDAAEEVVEGTRLLVEAGKARWRWDPEVDGVAGLVLADRPNRALVVVYDEGADFESSEELFEMLACTFDMGLRTDCGDDAAGFRDGFALCPRHLSHYDAMVKAEAEMAAMEQHGS